MWVSRFGAVGRIDDKNNLREINFYRLLLPSTTFQESKINVVTVDFEGSYVMEKCTYSIYYKKKQGLQSLPPNSTEAKSVITYYKIKFVIACKFYLCRL